MIKMSIIFLATCIFCLNAHVFLCEQREEVKAGRASANPQAPMAWIGIYLLFPIAAAMLGYEWAGAQAFSLDKAWVVTIFYQAYVVVLVSSTILTRNTRFDVCRYLVNIERKLCETTMSIAKKAYCRFHQ